MNHGSSDVCSASGFSPASRFSTKATSLALPENLDEEIPSMVADGQNATLKGWRYIVNRGKYGFNGVRAGLRL